MAALDKFINRSSFANAPPLSDEAIRRESVYREKENRRL
jgi:hypothetical protein